MYQVTDFISKEKLENTLIDFGMRGQWKEGAEKCNEYLAEVPGGNYSVKWFTDHCEIIEKDTADSFKFDTISLITNEEYKELREGMTSTTYLIAKWIALIDQASGLKKYIMVDSSNLPFLFPTFAESYDDFNGKVPFSIIHHRNLALYITLDENGNHKMVSEKIDKEKPVDVHLINPDFISDESILEDGFKLTM